ncbi:hypothetical protein C1Y08_14195 [Pseudomonas sp. FW306-02-F02-AA]|uniref:Uncharacterized protein n=1 Tax=Pseudomonas fluorescens TaxID=294 RepID=A0A0N9WE15_PSEFL|nr:MULTISPECIES: hypothetical protein [Pseudomonas]ALI02625.1 hypothetical protein AO353_16645 [Pseudomonas fluorescens]PMZ05067.1 hypothetical protein C1Y07_06045 [Pseudomonas sp. FW306-02-F02-AB]PMZ10864.1 hypothetical protein C1Y06_06780 [Pseudomonas sp. FW306-02-H06C]PMZ15201.1 hypothetical protein C1Y08_14195 [Pseudomonas sp. FW306-02-F02-AA]PMZ22562.1 hypothetical protein C1Y09_07985 [Pseudomonas sp. FW306-02-F08-AA]
MSPSVINKPSELIFAIGEALRPIYPGLKVGGYQDFDGVVDDAWVLIAIQRDAAGTRANDGRIAHVLTISLQGVVAGKSGHSGLEACNLASALKDIVTDNRWGVSGGQCDLPMSIEAVPSTFTSGEQVYDAWTVSFSQTLYFGSPLLDEPTGTPKFAFTSQVSNIDDPDQYTALV